MNKRSNKIPITMRTQINPVTNLKRTYTFYKNVNAIVRSSYAVQEVLTDRYKLPQI